MGVLDINKTQSDITKWASLEQQLEHERTLSNHYIDLFEELTDCIVGEHYYNMCNDSWECSKQTVSDCKHILKDPLIHWLIKRKLKKDFCFTLN